MSNVTPIWDAPRLQRAKKTEAAAKRRVSAREHAELIRACRQIEDDLNAICPLSFTDEAPQAKGRRDA